MKAVLMIFGNLLALLVFGVGLIAPLTPSYGLFTLLDVALFVAVPESILLLCWFVCHDSIAKRILLVQILGIAAVVSFLLFLECGHS